MIEVPDCFYRVSMKAIILNETKDKFLICKDSIGYWDMPGGGLDWGEDHKEGLAREIQEEMGLKVKSIADNPSYFVTGTGTVDPNIRIANVIYETVLEDLNFTPTDECLEIKFVDQSDIISLKAFDGAAKLGEMFKPENHSN